MPTIALSKYKNAFLEKTTDFITNNNKNDYLSQRIKK